MAHDKSAPDSKQILFWGAISVLLLAALNPIFRSYYDSITRTQYQESLGGQASERQAFEKEMDMLLKGQPAVDQKVAESGPTGIQKVNTGAEGLLALRGWSETPNEQAVSDAEAAIESQKARAEENRKAAAFEAENSSETGGMPHMTSGSPAHAHRH